jgi:predicted RNA binding protein YcfA (HicA-like mRNA interferase family)
MKLYFASLQVKDKHMRKLVTSLKKAGLEVSITAKGHVRVVNKQTNQQVVVSSGRSGDPRTIMAIHKDLKKVGFNAKKEKTPIS